MANPYLVAAGIAQGGLSLWGGMKAKKAAKEAGKDAAKIEIKSLDEQIRQLERAELTSIGSNTARAASSGVKVGPVGDREVTGVNQIDYASPEQRYASSPTFRRSGGETYGAVQTGSQGSVGLVLQDIANEFQTSREFMTDIGLSRAKMARYSGNAQGDIALMGSLNNAIGSIVRGFA